MEISKRALYNLLRMNWQNDSSIAVEKWQVEDYRSLSTETLFQRLSDLSFDLDEEYFLEEVEQVDNPEELTEQLLEDEDDVEVEDQCYLIFFELWRRLAPEKRCLSIFCDALDHSINHYDSSNPEDPDDDIPDILENLGKILDESSDDGADPMEVFQSVAISCANDIETFIYDYAVEQLEAGNSSYASELVELFSDYVTDVRWMDVLRARILVQNDGDGAQELVDQILEEGDGELPLELILELLSVSIDLDQETLFITLLQKALSACENEEEFQDTLGICQEFCGRTDRDSKERAIQDILDRREGRDRNDPVDMRDPDFKAVLNMLKTRALEL